MGCCAVFLSNMVSRPFSPIKDTSSTSYISIRLITRQHLVRHDGWSPWRGVYCVKKPTECFHSTACYQTSYLEIPQWRAYRERKSKNIFIFYVTINLLCERMRWLYRIPRTPRNEVQYIFKIKSILRACRFNYFCQSGVAYRSTYAGCCPPAEAYLSIHTHYYDGRWHITWPTWLNTIVSYIFLSLGDDKSIKQYPVLLLFYNDELI